MKKKLVTLLCVTTLTASMLAGCGSKAETPAADTTTTTEETTDAAEETSDATPETLPRMIRETRTRSARTSCW